MKRRNFLKNTVLASSATMIPTFLRGYNPTNLMASRSGKILVVIQLSGGNDGLNTIVPWQNDLYYKYRPKLGIKPQKVLQISDQLGFNPALKSLRNLYDQGEMTILNSVGYPNPDRSHFRSMDIWQTASGSNDFLTTGWLGRYLDNDCTGCQQPHHALEMNKSISLALRGKDRSAFGSTHVRSLKKTVNNNVIKSIPASNHEHNETVAYLYKTLADSQQSANYLHEKSRLHKSKVTYPKNMFAQQLKQTAELITADSETRIYYLSLGGFDTHAFQQVKQAKLLTQYSEAVAAFTKDLKQNNLLDDTLIMTFSEFGRRVKQNASNGTDHGTANNVFLMGGNLKKKGFYNDAPDLVNLDNGDLKHQIDFRNIYADILDNWLGGSSTTILNGKFNGLGIV